MLGDVVACHAGFTRRGQQVAHEDLHGGGLARAHGPREDHFQGVGVLDAAAWRPGLADPHRAPGWRRTRLFLAALEDLEAAGATVVDPFEFEQFEELNDAIPSCRRFRHDVPREFVRPHTAAGPTILRPQPGRHQHRISGRA